MPSLFHALSADGSFIVPVSKRGETPHTPGRDTLVCSLSNVSEAAVTDTLPTAIDPTGTAEDFTGRVN